MLRLVVISSVAWLSLIATLFTQGGSWALADFNTYATDQKDRSALQPLTMPPKTIPPRK